MGVTNLMWQLESVMDVCPIQKLKTFDLHTIGVDISSWIYAAKKTDPVELCARRLKKLRDMEFQLHVVLDGLTPPAKFETQSRRKNLREKYSNAGLVPSRQKWEPKLIEVLEIMKIPYTVAPYEADFVLCSMLQHGIISVILSEDSDMILFGASRVFSKWNKVYECTPEGKKILGPNGKPILKPDFGHFYKIENLYKGLGYPFKSDLFLAFGIVQGCDYYTDGLSQVGFSMAKKMYGALYPDYSYKKMMKYFTTANSKLVVPQEFKKNFLSAYDAYKFALTYHHHSGQVVPFNPVPEGKSMSDYPLVGSLEEGKKKVRVFLPPVPLAYGDDNFVAKPSVLDAFVCRFCNASFESEELRNGHVIALHYTCPDCKKVILNNRDMARHRRSHSKDRPFVCPDCNNKFKTKRTLSKHRQRRHLNVRYLCDKCDKSYTSPEALNVHVLKKHSEASKSFICPICPHSSFVTKAELRNHERLTHGQRVHTCEICSKSFTSAAGLKSHKVVHRTTKDFVCPTCGDAFADKLRLASHVRYMHKLVDSFFCDVCGKGFKTNSALTGHRKRSGHWSATKTSED